MLYEEQQYIYVFEMRLCFESNIKQENTGRVYRRQKSTRVTFIIRNFLEVELNDRSRNSCAQETPDARCTAHRLWILRSAYAASRVYPASSVRTWRNLRRVSFSFFPISLTIPAMQAR